MMKTIKPGIVRWLLLRTVSVYEVVLSQMTTAYRHQS